jgi:hypothetical protein
MVVNHAGNPIFQQIGFWINKPMLIKLNFMKGSLL